MIPSVVACTSDAGSGPEPAAHRPFDAAAVGSDAEADADGGVLHRLWALRADSAFDQWSAVELRFEETGTLDSVRWLDGPGDVPAPAAYDHCSCTIAPPTMTIERDDVTIDAWLALPGAVRPDAPDADCDEVQFTVQHLTLRLRGDSGDAVVRGTAFEPNLRTCSEIQSDLEGVFRLVGACRDSLDDELPACYVAPMLARALAVPEDIRPDCNMAGDWLVLRQRDPFAARLVGNVVRVVDAGGWSLHDWRDAEPLECTSSALCTLDLESCSITGHIASGRDLDRGFGCEEEEFYVELHLGADEPWAVRRLPADSCEDEAPAARASAQLPRDAVRVYRFVDGHALKGSRPQEDGT